MTFLSLAKQTQVIAGLVEGNSIRSMERTTGVHRDTIMRLGVRVGNGCAQIMDEEMRNLTCEKIQADELWTYVGKRQRHMTKADDPAQMGDFWTFVAIDPDTKLIPSYLVGKRSRESTIRFIDDLSSRLVNRIQLSTDSWGAYRTAVERAFGVDIDYGQAVKVFDAESTGRDAPPNLVGIKRNPIVGRPERKRISTSHVERQNLTIRMSMKRFQRLTNGFSKKPENLRAAVGLHFCHYNFARIHTTTRVTPAMAAGVTNRVWSLEEIVERTAWTGAEGR